MEQLIQDNLAVLDDAAALIERLPADQNYRSIGAHLRHIVDHYDCFLNGVDGRLIDYDQRDRCKQTELSASFAARRLRNTAARLRAAAQVLPERVRVRLCTHADRDASETESSAARELQFLQSHCVHHFALIRRILDEQGVKLAAEFGKAPATVSFERASAQVS